MSKAQVAIKDHAKEKPSFSCDFCGKTYVREKQFLAHTCVQRTRVLEMNSAQSKIAYSAWVYYFTTNHPSIKRLETVHFAQSPFYSAFMKFATYCIDTKVINHKGYARFLLKCAVPVDKWGDDATYFKYLVSYLRLEDCTDAINRSLKFLHEYSVTVDIDFADVFRKINDNVLVDMIYFGRISPWLLFQTKSGIEFLDKLNDDQYKKIAAHINPEAWARKFSNEPDNVASVTMILKNIPGL